LKEIWKTERVKEKIKKYLIHRVLKKFTRIKSMIFRWVNLCSHFYCVHWVKWPLMNLRSGELQILSDKKNIISVAFSEISQIIIYFRSFPSFTNIEKKYNHICCYCRAVFFFLFEWRCAREQDMYESGQRKKNNKKRVSNDNPISSCTTRSDLMIFLKVFF
jgi:hypothetical protein